MIKLIVKGYNKNPTARIIRTLFRSTCVFSLIASKSTNCEISQEVDDPVIVQDVITVEKYQIHLLTIHLLRHPQH